LPGVRPVASPAVTATVQYRPMGGERWRDPFPLYARLREEQPVHLAPGGFWVLSRFADVFEAARDTATFSSEHGLTFRNDPEELGLLPTVVMMDPPAHTASRRRVSARFTPRQVGHLEPALREHVRGCVEDLVEQGGGDLVAAVAQPVPCFVVAHYLGVDEADRRRFGEWTDALVQSGDHPQEALAGLYGFFTELIARRRRSPAGDLVSELVSAGLSTEEILGYAFVMVTGGNDTAIGLIAGGAELLSANPDQRRRLVDDPALLPGAVEELLRLTSPVQGLCRVTTRDVTLHGTELPAGSRVLLCYGAANRDRREFGTDADDLDVTRRIVRHLAFGAGAHFCLGASAARLQARLVFEELLRRAPDFTVDSAAGTYAEGAFTRRHRSLPFRPSAP
jgi:cytochrome P450 family 130